MAKPKEVGMKSVLVYTTLLNAGSSCLWPLTTMYMHDYLHRSLTESGLILFLMSMFMILGNYVGGFLFDHWSAYKTALISILISTVSIILLIFFHGWPTFAILLVVHGFGDGVSLTLINSYASTIKSKSPRYVFNTLYVGLNIGVVLGTAMVGYLLKYGVTTVFTVTAGFYLILLLMAIRLFNIDFTGYDHNRQVKSSDETKSKTMGLLLAICFLIFSIYLIYAIWESVMPIHMTQLGMSFEEYSSVWTVNGLMIVFGQTIVSKIGRKFAIDRQIAVGIFIFGLAFLFLVFDRSYISFILTIAFLTIGEMIGFPDLPAWIDSLASDSQKGLYQSFFSISMSLGRAIGPLYAGAFVEYLNYNSLFIFSFILIVVAIWLVLFRNQILKRNEKSE
ncbi:MFS transporter [Lactobacillus sp. Sy-1]|uniref:MDR family MFS transporter n=1 Tax=Lactobacillus sp. Sy-1 TaxID=2109645 RepID=UPI001C58544C|nr:MFS transporter [Lactobacillus sp. Sy-1]MBW1604917.1 MFS transporter [Lactobacillus sp. Sy-1]